MMCAVSLAGASFAPAQARVVHPAGCSRLILTGHPTYPPIAWAVGATLDGAGIAMVRRLAKDAGVSLAVVNEGSWAGAQRAVETGKVDAIVGIYYTQPRARIFNYVRPAFTTDPSAVVARSNAHFSYAGWKSLIGKRGVAGAGESFGRAFDGFLESKLTVRRVNGFDAVYRALADRSADYGLVGYYQAITAGSKNVAIVAPSFVTEGFYLAFDKSSPCSAKLSDTFSKDIARLVADGTIGRLITAALAQYRRRH
jgi:polar amino acid transport system substrate-binding protein